MPSEIECLFLMFRNVVPFELNKYISHMFTYNLHHVMWEPLIKQKYLNFFHFLKKLSSVLSNQRPRQIDEM